MSEHDDELREVAEEHAKGYSYGRPVALQAFLEGAQFERARLAKRLEAAEKMAMTIQHALALDYLGEGSTNGMAKEALDAWEACK